MGRDTVVRGRGPGARGDHRGRCWGDILSSCSYSRIGPGGHDGGRVGGVHELGVPLIIAHILSLFCTTINQLLLSICVAFLPGVFSKSLIGEIMGKECEREEN